MPTPPMNVLKDPAALKDNSIVNNQMNVLLTVAAILAMTAAGKTPTHGFVLNMMLHAAKMMNNGAQISKSVLDSMITAVLLINNIVNMTMNQDVKSAVNLKFTVN